MPLRALLAALVLASCGAAVSSVGPNTIVNGWAIGDASACAGDESVVCAAFIEVATERLGGRDVGHASIVSAVVHAEGLYPNLDGDLGPVFRSGMGGFCCVVLFQLADGTYRGIGVGRVPTQANQPPYTFDIGPERRDEHTDTRTPAPTI